MFRLGGPKLDPAEEKKMALQEEKVARMIVFTNVGSFFVCVGAIAASKY